jgi:hypothetical protein
MIFYVKAGDTYSNQCALKGYVSIKVRRRTKNKNNFPLATNSMATLPRSLTLKLSAYERNRLLNLNTHALFSFKLFCYLFPILRGQKGLCCTSVVMKCMHVCVCQCAGVTFKRKQKNFLADLIKPTFILIDFFF